MLDAVGLQGPPAAHPSIGPDLVERLIAAQHPDLAALEVGSRFDGWDMAVFRLGDSLAVRLPRVEAAVRSLQSESRWLAELGGAWDFPFPRVERHGEPGEGFPWQWTIVTWLEGDTADATPLAADAGAIVGRALAQVHVPAPAEAHINPEQSIPLDARIDEFEWALSQVLSGQCLPAPGGASLGVDAAAVRAIWAAALAAPTPGAPVFSHADAHGSNLLSKAGAFAGIIDWGKSAACDRAVDLGFLYTAMPAAGVDAALAAYAAESGHADDGLRARAMGIGLAKCLSWATLTREVNVAMAWRGLAELGVVVATDEPPLRTLAP